MMESKLLVGGKSIVDKTTEQERALEERRRELAEQRVSRTKQKLQMIQNWEWLNLHTIYTHCCYDL